MNKHIRNSTAEFLIFTAQAGEQSIEARYEDESVCLSQKLMVSSIKPNSIIWMPLFPLAIGLIQFEPRNFGSGQRMMINNCKPQNTWGKIYLTGQLI